MNYSENNKEYSNTRFKIGTFNFKTQVGCGRLSFPVLAKLKDNFDFNGYYDYSLLKENEYYYVSSIDVEDSYSRISINDNIYNSCAFDFYNAKDMSIVDPFTSSYDRSQVLKKVEKFLRIG